MLLPPDCGQNLPVPLPAPRVHTVPSIPVRKIRVLDQGPFTARSIPGSAGINGSLNAVPAEGAAEGSKAEADGDYDAGRSLLHLQELPRGIEPLLDHVQCSVCYSDRISA